MVLGPQGPGRVGRCQAQTDPLAHARGSFCFIEVLLPRVTDLSGVISVRDSVLCFLTHHIPSSPQLNPSTALPQNANGPQRRYLLPNQGLANLTDSSDAIGVIGGSGGAFLAE